MRHFCTLAVALGALGCGASCPSLAEQMAECPCGSRPGHDPHPDQNGCLIIDCPPACSGIDLGVQDAATSGPAGCYALVGGASSLQSPIRSTDLEQAFLTCVAEVCGDPMNADGGAGLPCTVEAAGGARTTVCDRCTSNVQVNTFTTFTDASGRPIQCVSVDTGVGDPNGLGCSNGVGACAMQIIACVLDCNSDADCRELTHSDGTRSTCLASQCQ